MDNYVIRLRTIQVLPNCAGDAIYDYKGWGEKLETQMFFFLKEARCVWV